jgi:uncharacterized protein DUF4232
MHLLRTVVAAGVIPWLPTTPPSPPAPRLAPPCRSAALASQLELQSATGSLAGGVSLRNRGSGPCSLRGRVEVGLTGGSDSRGVHLTTLAPQQPEPGVPVPSLDALRPDESAFVEIWWSNWCGASAPTGLDVRLPSGDEIHVLLDRGAPFCNAPDHFSTLAVGPPEPRAPQPKYSSRLPLAASIVEHLRLGAKVVEGVHAHPGQLALYYVALTNTSSRPFHFPKNCPIYAEGTGLGQRVELHVLNCDPVATIQPGSEVVFEMRIRVPHDLKPGLHALTWQLAPASYLPPFAGGVIVTGG